MRWSHVVFGIWALVLAGILALTCFALPEYQGSAWVYLLFTVLSTAVLFFGFGRGAIFFDSFLGVLLWIGFWLKFSVRTAFYDGLFNITVGEFDGSGASLDQVLLVVCCAFMAILFARFIRQSCFFSYPSTLPQIGYVGLFAFYRRYRVVLLCAFILGVLLVSASNAWLGIYQRGQVARTNLPFGLNGVFTWLLTFGMASVSAVILRFEFELSRKRYWIAISIALLEAALSNVSLWSRGMILNSSSLLYGAVAQFKRGDPKVPIKLSITAGLVFCVLFAFSVYAVNYMRAFEFKKLPELVSEQAVGQRVATQTSVLFLDRWVGIEGVMSIVGAEHLGFDVFKAALGEKFDTRESSFYDQNFLNSPYDNSQDDGLHFVSLPGYIAFLFYSGSYVFLFVGVFVFSILAACLEYFVYRFGGRNLVLCALIAQVVAFRYTSFGYVPMQSYLLFGSILLNVLILYFFDRLLRLSYKS